MIQRAERNCAVHEKKKKGINNSGPQGSISIALGHQNALGSLPPSDLQEDDLPFQDVTVCQEQIGENSAGKNLNWLRKE